MIRKSKRALSDAQVHQARYDYYNENLTQKELAERYNTTPRVIQKVIQSLDSYAEVPDQTPAELKAMRIHPNTDPMNGQYVGRRAQLRERKKQAEIDHAEKMKRYREAVLRKYPDAAENLGFITREEN